MKTEQETQTLQEPALKYSSNNFGDLPEHVKESIRIGLEQSERGEGIPYEEVMTKLKARLRR